MDYQPSVPPKSAPDLRIPKSDATVKVSAIDSGARFDLPVEKFLNPQMPGKDRLTGPAFSFLVEHPSGKKCLFDLGIISDLKSYPQGIQDRIQNGGWKVDTGRDIADILTSEGIQKDSIDEIIWSHWHWDHVGAPWLFPSSTSLIVGPGFKKAFLPGYPEDPKSRVNQRSWEDRELRELDFSSTTLKLGRFEAIDWYGDGSFYLLHTPGHAIGHMCALARTTSSTFVYMGGDVCHHGGEMRPTPYLPLPKELTPVMVPKLRSVCPGSLLEEVHRNHSTTEPFYEMTKTFPTDLEQAQWSLEGTEEFDASNDVLVALAHDESLIDVLNYLPEGLNDWKELNVAEKARWRFLGDFKVREGH